MSKNNKVFVDLTPEQFKLLDCKNSKKKQKKYVSKLQDCILYLLNKTHRISPFFFNYILKTNFQFSTEIEKLTSNGKKHVINPEWFLTLDTETGVLAIYQIVHAEAHLAAFRAELFTKKDLWSMAVFLSTIAAWNGTDYSTQREQAYSVDPLVDYILFEWRTKEQSYENIYKELLKIEKDKPEEFENLANKVGASQQGGDSNSTSPIDLKDFPGSQLEKELAENKIKQSVNSIMKNTESGDTAGTGSAELDALITEWFKPKKLNWKQILSQFLVAKYPIERSWKRRNRRYNKIYMPSKEGNALGDISICIDTSASMDLEVIGMAINHIQQMVEQLSPMSIMFYLFDTQLQSIQKTYRGADTDLIGTIDIKGRGGTCINSTIDAAIETSNQLDLMLVITDGELDMEYAEQEAKNNGFTLFWLITEKYIVDHIDEEKNVMKYLYLEKDESK